MGQYVQLSGHIVLIAAAAVGLIAIPLALIAADSKDKKESQKTHSHQSSQSTTTNNFFFFGDSFGSRSTASTISPQDFMCQVLLFSLVSSAIGIALSLCLGVPWVAGLVGGLWLAGFGLSSLGQYIVDCAKQMPQDSESYVRPPAFNPHLYPAPAASAPPEDPGEYNPFAYQYFCG